MIKANMIIELQSINQRIDENLNNYYLVSYLGIFFCFSFDLEKIYNFGVLMHR